MAHTYSHLFDLPTTGLRFFTVYGPWGRPDMALFLFTKAILDGEPIQVFNDGKMIRDFTYIDDIVSGIKGAILNPSRSNKGDILKLKSSSSSAPYRIFNLGNNQPITLESFINAIEASTGKKAIKEYLPIQPGDVQKTFANIDKAGESLGFIPTTSIEEGIKKFVSWYIGIMRDNLCLITGGFDPIHQGHVEYIKSAKEISSYLVIGLNSDDWLCEKELCFHADREEVLKSISYVDEVIAFDDSDDSAYDAINICLKKSKKVIFANGGDRNRQNIPELALFKNNNKVDFMFSVGGDLKIESSSSLTSNFYNNFTKILNSEKGVTNFNDISSPWGFHNLVIDNKSYKVKILSINPN